MEAVGIHNRGLSGYRGHASFWQQEGNNTSILFRHLVCVSIWLNGNTCSQGRTGSSNWQTGPIISGVT